VIRVGLAGATGWTGTALSIALHEAADITLVNGVSRSHAGKDLGEVLTGSAWEVPVMGSVADALDGIDVLVDYTSHDAIFEHTMAAIGAGVHVVVGSSGLTSDDFQSIEDAALLRGVGVIAAGNFALTAALAQAAALLAARFLPSWEVIDYAWAGKPDVPSGTARELAEKLSMVHRPEHALDPDRVAGPKAARGADVDGTRVHSLRLPGVLHVGTDAVFGMTDERLVIRFEAGDSPTPYVFGTLVAVRAITSKVGLVRGLDTLLLQE
jgi:4-hydroxy-tetrahydrodipicolinate reductase